jgi:hypothetical protein
MTRNSVTNYGQVQGNFARGCYVKININALSGFSNRMARASRLLPLIRSHEKGKYMNRRLSDDEDYNLWVLLAQTRHALFKVRQKELDQYNLRSRRAAVLFGDNGRLTPERRTGFTYLKRTAGNYRSFPVESTTLTSHLHHPIPTPPHYSI